MQSLSVVIVCKNEAHIIGNTLRSLQGISDDIIVYDNGSTDETVAIARSFPAKVYEGAWRGFGITKNLAIDLAKHDWILSLDADEEIDEELKKTLTTSSFMDEKMVYEVRFKNFFGKKWLRFGEWGSDKHIRFFNRRQISWDEAQVHEQLIMPEATKVGRMKGNILHHTATDIRKYKLKLANYAKLNAKKYYEEGKKAWLFKEYFAAFFSFIQNYIFKAGFLDGKAGYQCAVLTAGYTYKKYRELDRIRHEAYLESIM